MTAPPERPDDGGPDDGTGDESAGDGATGGSRPTSLRLATAGLIVAGFALFAFGVWRGFGDDDGRSEGSPSTVQRSLSALADVARRVGDACLELIVADTTEERAQGLRFREEVLDEVDGMLFVYEEPQPPGGTFFTMSGVVEPLELGFYAATGERVGGHVMEPCAGEVSDCPRYPPPAPFVAAIETKPGELPAGPLGPECTPDGV